MTQPPAKLSLSKVIKHPEKTDAYVVVMEASSIPVKATFQVSIRSRRGKGSKPPLKNHTEIEKLEKLATEEVLNFCYKLLPE